MITLDGFVSTSDHFINVKILIIAASLVSCKKDQKLKLTRVNSAQMVQGTMSFCIFYFILKTLRKEMK